MSRVFVGMLEFLERLPRLLLLSISVAMVGSIAFVSYATQVDLRFSFFYLLPIAMSSWFVGRLAGVVLSFASAICWAASYVGEHGLSSMVTRTALANAPILLGFFLVLSLLLSALREALNGAKEAARLDPLTGIANRRAFFELTESEIQRASRYGGHFSLVFIDLDDFKAINDRGGHETGDRTLSRLARTLRENLRATDVVARVGGDEFILLLPETGAEEGASVVGKLHRQIEKVLLDAGSPGTFSAGCVTFETPPESVDRAVRLADELMYSVKTSGKGRSAWRTVGR